MWDAFFLKKAVERIFYPEYLALLFVLVGAAWAWRTRSVRGVYLIVAGAVGLIVASIPVTGTLLIRSLEMRAGTPMNPENMVRQGIRNIVVLNDFLEAADLWQQIPDSRLIVSSPTGMALVKRALKMDPTGSRVVSETASRDTQEQAAHLTRYLGKEKFALVTWAGHMPRALAIFRKLNLHPVPAPIRFVTVPESWFAALRPSKSGLALTRHALHEYAGMLWLDLESAVNELWCFGHRNFLQLRNGFAGKLGLVVVSRPLWDEMIHRPKP